MDKKKIKQKIKELEALLEEPSDKTDSDFRLKLNTGSYHYGEFGHIVTGRSEVYSKLFNCFITAEQTKTAAKRKSAQDELLQMAFILNGDWKPDWKNDSEQKFAINFDNGSHNFFCDAHYVYSSSHVFFKNSPFFYFVATASDNLKAYIKGELQ